MIRRISLAVLALATLVTAACSNPTAPTAPTKVAHDGVVTAPSATIPVQGSGI